MALAIKQAGANASPRSSFLKSAIPHCAGWYTPRCYSKSFLREMGLSGHLLRPPNCALNRWTSFQCHLFWQSGMGTQFYK